MKLSEELIWRGLIKDKTFDDISWLDQPQTFYHGIDGSGDSLHVGNLAALVLAKRLMDHGWKAVLLVGGATSLVGDPGGKETERELKTKEEIEHNVSAIKSQIEKLFSSQPVTYVNNIDWFGDMRYLDFLRDVGKHYSMTELTQRDYIAQRMGEHGSGISYAEFSYTLVQGYDFWYLYKHHQAVLQIGGSDQWGNMLSGVPLIRKKENAEAHVMTMPLVVNKLTGRKFGKSEEGAVWLNPSKTSETQFRQFWINTDDADVADYLKIFTLISKEEFDELITRHNSHPEAREAQRYLSDKVTEIVFGGDSSEAVSLTEKLITGQISVEEVDPGQVELPHFSEAKFHEPNMVVQALVATGLASSNSDARRLLESNAVYINGQQINRSEFLPEDSKNGKALLRRGKAYKDSALILLN
ncbi:tyrosine--tRNA ligase [Candidatus Saccharibacteria bacterium]|nr:tyrosine--tRNA ligase [Candidatus Saccharibacteria bacterium]